MRYRRAISHESDTNPVEALCGERDAREVSHAALRGGREATKRYPKGRTFRSVVVVVERLDEGIVEVLPDAGGNGRGLSRRNAKIPSLTLQSDAFGTLGTFREF